MDKEIEIVKKIVKELESVSTLRDAWEEIGGYGQTKIEEIWTNILKEHKNLNENKNEVKKDISLDDLIKIYKLKSIVQSIKSYLYLTLKEHFEISLKELNSFIMDDDFLKGESNEQYGIWTINIKNTKNNQYGTIFLQIDLRFLNYVIDLLFGGNNKELSDTYKIPTELEIYVLADWLNEIKYHIFDGLFDIENVSIQIEGFKQKTPYFTIPYGQQYVELKFKMNTEDQLMDKNMDMSMIVEEKVFNIFNENNDKGE